MKNRDSPRERFFGLAQPEPNSGCLLWTATTNGKGYGKFSLTPVKRVSAHRFAWEIARGPIPNGLFVMHRCDTPLCVNVDHLSLGTHEENMADMVSKKRHPGGVTRGVDHPLARLTEGDVVEIRALRACGAKYRELKRRFGVSTGTIAGVVLGYKWAHLPGGES